MPSAGNVIVDTSVWVDYLRGRDETVRQEVVSLLQEEQAYVCGVVLTELLAGARTDGDRERIYALFRGVPYLEVARATWAGAGSLASRLRAQGKTLPLADLIISAIALEHGYRVFTHDVHFQLVPDLVLYPSR